MIVQGSSLLSELISRVRNRFTRPPRCHPFRTQRRDYVFDTDTGEIIGCDPLSAPIIRHLGQRDFAEFVQALVQEHGAKVVIDQLKQFLALSEERDPPLLSTTPPKTIRYHLDFQTFKRLLDHKLQSMVLSVTDACNMACRYCVYAGAHPSRSPHSNHFMSEEVLQSALEYFVKHSAETERPHIGFYGGEPTLATDHIRYTVKYLSDELVGKPYSFGMTTNFLNITGEMFSIFRDHDFMLRVSLDGPQELHDRYRVRADGAGTFVQITENLRRLKQMDEDYYDRRVSLVSTMAPPYRLHELRDFLEKDNLVPKRLGGFRCNFMDSPHEVFDNCPPEFFDNASYRELKQEYLERARRGEIEESYFLRTMFDSQYLYIYRRGRGQLLSDTLFPGGICVPGQRKLYVRWDGAFFPCERVPEYRSLQIGNRQEGLDVEKAYRLCTDFAELTANECAQCWAVRLCREICFRSAFDENGPAREKKLEACEAQRQSLSRRLSEMCSVLEANPSAFDYMNSYVVS